jgi:hypothetical protein
MRPDFVLRQLGGFIFYPWQVLIPVKNETAEK